MQQPELGKSLTALRKGKNFTQEELAEKSHVSVRTIQRIEAGEVLPRMSTVKILWKALEEDFESFSSQTNQDMETHKNTRTQHQAVLVASIAGAVYLVSQIILGAMDLAWFSNEFSWNMKTNVVYTLLTACMVISFALFARGFIVLSSLFDNSMLKVSSYFLIAATLGVGVLDLASLSVIDKEVVWFPYVIASVLLGSLSIVFGIALIRLQDGMGELSKIAGLLEIAYGCLLITVVLFFISFVIMIPAVIVEILLLHRAYEYLSRESAANA